MLVLEEWRQSFKHFWTEGWMWRWVGRGVGVEVGGERGGCGGGWGEGWRWVGRGGEVEEKRKVVGVCHLVRGLTSSTNSCVLACRRLLKLSDSFDSSETRSCAHKRKQL